MSAAFMTVDCEGERRTRLTFDARSRLRAGRSGWLFGPWLDAWLFVSRRFQEMDLVRRLAAKRFVRSVLTVPVDRESYFAFEFASVFRDRNQP
jgi:hypothetical protein